MLNNIKNFIDTHPIDQIFKLGFKKAVWKKVGQLKIGTKIAIEKDGQLGWDEIVEIKPIGRKRVYDIEVEGTHNFVGNGILAHNTYISGDVGIGDTSPDAVLDIDSTATTGNIFGILSTTLTTGEIADITATYAPTDGSTNEAIDINLTHSPTTLADIPLGRVLRCFN